MGIIILSSKNDIDFSFNNIPYKTTHLKQSAWYHQTAHVDKPVCVHKVRMEKLGWEKKPDTLSCMGRKVLAVGVSEQAEKGLVCW